LPDLLSICQVAHLTGRGKNINHENSDDSYKVFEFLDQSEVLGLMAAADVVISRCGLGVLTELSTLGKAVILIPIPDSHQEENAAVFQEREACLLLDQKNISASILNGEVKKLLTDDKLRGRLSSNISKIMKPNAARNIAEIIFDIIKI